MLIKTLENNIYNVETDELYVKPFYHTGDSIKVWCICVNQRNQEIVLGSYSEKKIAEHMLDILKLCSYTDFTMELVPEVQICQDLYFSAVESLKKATNMYMKGVIK